MQQLAITIAVPDSRLPFPRGLWNQVKYFFWKAISPGYLFGYHFLLRISAISHRGRQDFLVGHLAPGVDVNDFVRYLVGENIKNHFIAWEDDDQIISLRKVESFDRQYHLRIFNDGEVRGHYEWTPEAHPVWHLKEVGFERRREEFLKIVGTWVVPAEE